MKVHFDVGHPAHVHLFKHAITELQARGHETLVTSREKEVAVDLLDAYGIDHVPISRKGDSTLDLAREWFVRELKLVWHARRFDADVILSHFNPSAAHAAAVTGAEFVMCNDDELAADTFGAVTHPFASVIATPACFREDLGERHRTFEGVLELAYLHPDRFDPDPGSLREHGVEVGEPYFVLRFVAWGAHHDVGEAGFSRQAKQDLVSYLDQHGTVYITSEDPIPPAFEEYRLPVPPADVHDLLYYADGYVGDSQTMALEAGVLGTPAVRSNSFAASDDVSNVAYLEAEYDLLYSFGDERAAIETVKELVGDPESQTRWGQRRETFVADAVDLTATIVELVEEVGLDE
jgi:predicted glycosyltransferase